MRRIALACLLLLARGTAAAADTAQQPQRYTYREIDGRTLAAHVFRPPGGEPGKPTAAILLFHGGGWSAGSPDWTFATARRFAERGMLALSIEYRLSGGDVTPVEALADACAAFRWVREKAAELSIDPARVAAHGVSAGGQLAAATVTVGCPGSSGSRSDGPAALLLWSPALDMAADGWFRKLLAGRAEPQRYSPVEHVRASTPPTSIIQGELDTLTPARGARRFCERLVELGGVCELQVYEGVGHLLTRNLANQESEFDPDPDKRADGIERQLRFLARLGFLTQSSTNPAPKD